MIENLEEKLQGQEPITREELLELVSSWGRKDTFTTSVSLGRSIQFYACEPNECYPLENLDVSQIINFNSIFKESMYNGDKRFKNNNSLLFLNF